MNSIVLIGFAVAFGLVFAGLFASLTELIIAEYTKSEGGVGGSLPVAVVMCMVAGPLILLRFSSDLLAGNRITGFWYAGTLLFCGVWSFCIGVFVVQSVHAVLVAF